MCWKIEMYDFDKNPKGFHHIADKDIEVYKVGYKNDKIFNPFYKNEFSYNINSPNRELKLKLTDENYYYDYYIDEGYHSFSENCKFTANMIIDREVFDIRTKDDRPLFERKIDNTIYIGKFIIPKGSDVYVNTYGEMVSSQLVWTGRFKCVPDIIIEDVTNIKFKDIEYVLDDK